MLQLGYFSGKKWQKQSAGFLNRSIPREDREDLLHLCDFLCGLVAEAEAFLQISP